MQNLPTYEDLFGSDVQAISFYRELFPLDQSADNIVLSAIAVANTKISPVFGSFRYFQPGEDTVRNSHICMAECYEANSIIETGTGGLNANSGDSRTVVSEKMEDVSVTYSDKKKTDDLLKDSLGLISLDAAILLGRYVRKTFGMGVQYPFCFDADSFCGVC